MLSFKNSWYWILWSSNSYLNRVFLTQQEFLNFNIFDYPKTNYPSFWKTIHSCQKFNEQTIWVSKNSEQIFWLCKNSFKWKFPNAKNIIKFDFSDDQLEKFIFLHHLIARKIKFFEKFAKLIFPVLKLKYENIQKVCTSFVL